MAQLSDGGARAIRRMRESEIRLERSVPGAFLAVKEVAAARTGTEQAGRNVTLLGTVKI